MLRHAIAPLSAYTKVSHSVVRNPRLTSDAKVLLCYLQGLPESSATSKALGEHAADLGMKPRAYQRAKESLAACGYLHEWRWQGGRGRWITEQLVANVTLTRDEATALRDGDRSPTVPDPTVGGPAPSEPGGSPQDEDGEKNNPLPPTGRPPSPDAGDREEPEERGGRGSPERARAEAQERARAEVRERPEVPPPAPAAGDPGPGSESDSAPGSDPDPGPELVRAERLLLTLHHAHRDLRLGVREARALAAVAAEWLRRGVSAGDLRHALTAHLPRTGVRSAAGFLRHRLTEKLPPETPPEAPFGEAPRPAPGPLVECEGAGEPHVFRPVAGETRCGPCRREAARGEAFGAPRPEVRPARADWRGRVAEAFAERPGAAWGVLHGAAGAEASGG
ncbi:hypothetical protein GCM10010363_01490 [Streptomyces omiyaensis]|uniref:hypothetical protein n=1 Tax=Streptomyces omiyaensis TaxID=68247 RepID=UPI001679C1B6|nr:hypothetical protein [Streptomyces omiyaensis]GGY25042.1 hypothetical protein GCM10010363_01490 [Streptomyces omiyaensis]